MTVLADFLFAFLLASAVLGVSLLIAGTLLGVLTWLDRDGWWS